MTSNVKTIGRSLLFRPEFTLQPGTIKALEHSKTLKESSQSPTFNAPSFHRMPLGEIQPFTISSDLQRTEFCLNLISESIDTARGIEVPFSRSRAFCEIARLLSKIGEVEKAASVVGEALRAAKEVEELSSQFNQLTQALGIEKDNELFEMFSETLDIDWTKETSETLIEIAKTLAQTGKKEDALMTLNETQKVIANIEDLWDKSRILIIVSECFAQMGEIEHAIGKLNEALQITEQMDNPAGQSVRFSEIAQSLFQKGQSEKANILIIKAINISDQIAEYRDGVYAFSNITDSLIKLDPKRAIEFARRIQSTALKAVKLAEISQALAQTGRIKEANDIIEEAALVVMQKSESNDDHPHDLYWASCKTFLIMHIVQKIPVMEEFTIKTIRNIEGPARLWGLSEAAKLLAKEGKIDEAFKLFKEAYEYLKQSDDSDKSSSLTRIIEALWNIDPQIVSPQRVEAWQVCKNLDKRALLHSVISEASKAASEIDASTEAQIKIRALIGISELKFRSGNISEAFELLVESQSYFGRLKNQYEKSQIGSEVAGLLRKYVAAGVNLSPEKLEEILDFVILKKNVFDPSQLYMTVFTLAIFLGLKGETNRAREYAEKNGFSELVIQSHDFIIKATSYTGQENKENAVNNLTRALAIIKRIEDPTLRSALLCEAGHVFVKIGELNEAIKITCQIENPIPKSELFIDIIESLIQKEELEDSTVDLAENMENPFYRAIALRNIAGYFAKRGKFKEAYEIAGKIEEKEMREDTQLRIAGKLALAGETDRAFGIIWDITSGRGRYLDLVFEIIVRSLIEKGEEEKAKEFLKKINIGEVTLEFLKKLALIRSKLGTSSLESLDESLDNLSSDVWRIPERFRSTAYIKIAETYAQIGMINNVICSLVWAFEDEEIPFKDLEALIAIGNSMAREGKSNEAFEILKTAKEQTENRLADFGQKALLLIKIGKSLLRLFPNLNDRRLSVNFTNN